VLPAMAVKLAWPWFGIVSCGSTVSVGYVWTACVRSA